MARGEFRRGSSIALPETLNKKDSICYSVLRFPYRLPPLIDPLKLITEIIFFCNFIYFLLLLLLLN